MADLENAGLPPQRQSFRAIFLRGASSALAVRVSGVAVGLAVQIFAARLLGTTAYGEYIYVLSWLNVFIMLSLLGFDRASLRFVAAYRATREWPLLRGFIRRSRGMALLASTGLGALAALGVLALRNRIGNELALAFWLACAALPAAAMLQLTSNMLRALKWIVWALAPVEVLRPLAFAAALPALCIVIPGLPKASVAMLAFALATAVALATAGNALRAALPRETRTAPVHERRSHWRHVSFGLLLLAACQVAFAQTDVLLLGALVDTSQAGIYSVAVRIAGLASFALVSVNAIAAPMISELCAARKLRQLQELLTLAVRGVSAVALPAGVVIAVAGDKLLHIWGPDFVSGYVPLVILAAGQLINALAGSVGSVMVMAGHEGAAGRILAVIAVTNGLLDMALIPLFGTVGAALATAATTIAWNVALLRYVRRHVGVNPSLFPIPPAAGTGR